MKVNMLTSTNIKKGDARLAAKIAKLAIFWPEKSFIAFLDELGNSKSFEAYLFFRQIGARQIAKLAIFWPPKIAKNKCASKCLELPNSSRNAIKKILA